MEDALGVEGGVVAQVVVVEAVAVVAAPKAVKLVGDVVLVV